jgi:hypothetical protein
LSGKSARLKSMSEGGEESRRGGGEDIREEGRGGEASLNIQPV